MQSIVGTSQAAPAGAHWLRSARFDVALVFGVLAVALVMGGVAAARPALFPAVLALDVWLFAYPHVTSTYTRIAFDRESARRHWFLLLGLPPLVVGATAAIAALWGVRGLFTAYFIGQTYHYTRQSYGIARAYRRTAAGAPSSDLLSDAVVYAVPLWGLLHRAAERPAEFYDNPVALPPVPPVAAHVAGVLACGACVVWAAREAARLRRGELRAGHASFVLSHVLVTGLGYVVISGITSGWLFVNVWHNAQYLLFVWAFNARRFEGRRDPAKRLLSHLCQPRNAWQYALVCVGVGAALYAALGELGERISVAALPVVLVLHLSVNFHHYLVDGVIWKTRSPAEGAARRAEPTPS